MKTQMISIVQTTFPDTLAAEQAAATLLHERLAACVQIHAPVSSRYYWEGQLEIKTEIPMTLKIYDAADANKAMERLRALHPYSTPEILHSNVYADSDYAAWVEAETHRRKGLPQAATV